jgi:hypothetical protein
MTEEPTPDQHAERCRLAGCTHAPEDGGSHSWCTSCRALAFLFDPVWRECEVHGWCDAWGGAEYERVVREWFVVGRPLDVATWIRRRANWIPGQES